jgi:hypothetical protein
MTSQLEGEGAKVLSINFPLLVEAPSASMLLI